MSVTRKTVKKTARKANRPVLDLNRPELFVNRELSWLEFNQRVLEEAQDASNPLLERLKFLAIVSSNLDEFFEIRVAGLQRQAETHPHRTEPDGLTPQQTLAAIAKRVERMVHDQYRCYRDDIMPALATAGIDLQTVEDLGEAGRAWAGEYFQREVFPVLTPLAVDPAHPFPQLLNKSLNLAVVLASPESAGDGWHSFQEQEGTRLGVVQVPRVLPRLVAVAPEYCPAGRKVYIFLSSLISEHIGQLFPGLAVQGCYAFRVTRNSEFYLDEDEADNLLEAVEEQLQRRRRGDAVRLEVQRGCDPLVAHALLATFELDAFDMFEVDGPINLTRLMAVYSAEKNPALKDPPLVPVTPKALRHIETADELFNAIRHEDILLHHPYENFNSVVDFIVMAADDPHVLAIKQTLYRTSGDSPIVRALMRAAENGKQVTALVELRARFDEENNIQWARAMEEAGVHVLYGLVGLKTHCKLALVVRREEHEIRRYVHLGTGNYNEITAHFYTDAGLLTANPVIGEDVAKIFNLITGMGRFPGLQKLFMAPFNLQGDFLRLIEREIAHARRKKHKTARGKAEPRIVAKMNSLVDPEIIKALYRASQAGVSIDLIVRGVCCLRPGIPGVSDHIRVRSIVDRFLEHSRIYYFANGGDEEIYLGSADWMPRNFFNRVEVIFPLLNEALKARVKDEILHAALVDNVKGRLMTADGCYQRPKRTAKKPSLRAQQWLIEQAMQSTAETTPEFLSNRPAPSPMAATSSTPSPPTPKIISRGAAPPAWAVTTGALPAGDGRAGTTADPVLQSLKQTLAAGSENENGAVDAARQDGNAAGTVID